MQLDRRLSWIGRTITLPAMLHRACLGLLLACTAIVGCQPSRPAQDAAVAPQPASTITAPPLSPTREEPMVRVRVQANIAKVTLTGQGLVRVGPDASRSTVYRLPVTLTGGNGRVVAAAPGSAPTTFANAGIWAIPQEGRTIQVEGKNYQGQMRIEPATGQYARPNHLDVVVHLPMETYLPGVLHAELYPNWQLETYKAQAIAARSYTYFEMSLNQGKTYDLEGSIASQAYAGASASDTAHRAVSATSGVVLAWDNRVVPAFYSSACGGVNQFAGLALPHGTTAAPVNTARETCQWCKPSRYYRWGPIVRRREVLSQRIAAWGMASRHDVSLMGQLVRIDVDATTPQGRPTRYKITDDKNRTYTLGCEQLRFAANFAAKGLPPVTAAMNLRSSHCRVTVMGQDVRFEQGRGFGHGVGLCQWGAQGMAMQGRQAQTILAFYYPGATLTRLY